MVKTRSGLKEILKNKNGGGNFNEVSAAVVEMANEGFSAPVFCGMMKKRVPCAGTLLKGGGAYGS